MFLVLVYSCLSVSSLLWKLHRETSPRWAEVERERERERERGLHNLELFQSKGGDIVILKSIIRPIETVAIRVLKSTDAFEEVEREELGSNY
ncbi:unnamed protein product [Camellia sinensis]